MSFKMSFKQIFSGLVFVSAFVVSIDIALAMDRTMAVHSRIESALSNILHRSDYLVIVNRIDQLEDGGESSASTGQVRRLPGLNIGVDSTGRVIRSDEAAGQYNGGVSISVIIDPAVKADTYALIQKNIPELAGGLRDSDEFRISRASLRQAPSPNSQAPQVSVNNNIAKDDSGGTNLLQQLAIGLGILGLFVWILSRMLAKQKDGSPSSRTSNPASQDVDAKNAAKNAIDEKSKIEKQFSELDPLMTGLYLLKAQGEKQIDRIRSWTQAADPSTQRAVLLALPGWVSSSLEKNLREVKSQNGSPTGKVESTTSIAAVYLEISVLEQNLKSPVEKSRALLSWFPANYLRDVPAHQRDLLSKESRMALWFLRPDLGNFVRQDSIARDLSSDDYDQALATPTDEAIEKCFVEMSSWNSKGIIGDRSVARDHVLAFASMINQLKEFGPIDSLINQSRERLSLDEFNRLESSVASARTPLSWSNAQIKDWLRSVDPQDFMWWCKVINEKPNWKLEELLRPLRLSMFMNAEKEPAYLAWKETERKMASERLLAEIRAIHLQKDAENDLSA